MTATALDRLERVLLMVPWLLAHPGATYGDIAGRFGGTVEDIAADLDTLGYCGLPGYGGGDLVEVTTFGDRVTIRMADFFRRPLQLSLREAVTLMLAARSFLQVEGLPESTALRRALTRLESLLGTGPGPDLGDARVAVDLRTEGDEHIGPLRAAIADRRVVSVTYRSASKAETTVREVEPWSLINAGGAWYLQGHCRRAGGHRDFRLDRIAALAASGERFATRPGAPPQPPAYRPSPADQTVSLDVHRSAWWFAERLAADDADPNGTDATDEPDWRTVTLRTGSLEWLARAVLPLGVAVRVRGPQQLNERVRHLATALHAMYRDDPA